MQVNSFLLLLLAITIFSCQPDDRADLIITNARIYAVDTTYIEATAIAIKDGLILKIGTDTEIEKLSNENTEKINAEGKFVMPGFIEGHGHYSGL